eukprot:357753-Chlamydomonas_euryale.AAC.6
MLPRPLMPPQRFHGRWCPRNASTAVDAPETLPRPWMPPQRFHGRKGGGRGGWELRPAEAWCGVRTGLQAWSSCRGAVAACVVHRHPRPTDRLR